MESTLIKTKMGKENNSISKINYRYYKRLNHFVSWLNELKEKFNISDDVYNKIIIMFEEIQEPFDRHCPSDRKNFLSYPYTLHKIFKILELSEYIHYFDLPSNIERLEVYEGIWEKICHDLKWPFYSSIYTYSF